MEGKNGDLIVVLQIPRILFGALEYHFSTFALGKSSVLGFAEI